ncbi:MAG: Gfo/Idh/MocA family oxidoreductase [Lewinella sp.]|nr:Gfo/Idh/MocA family oxidoreductase [Lewinella sp.]
MALPGASIAAVRPEEKKLGIALVGLGRYSTFQLAPALQETEHCRLAAIVTGTPEKAEKWSKDFNIPQKNIYNYDTFDSIKDNPEIDIVYVVLPNFMHAEYTIRAAKAGKHVICEKPMAMSVDEGKKMVEACKLAGVKLQVGYRLYYEPHHLESRRLAKEQVYGKVNLVEASLGFSMADPTTWRLDKDMGGGGAIVDLGLYAIQGARRVFGTDPVSITAQGYVFQPDIFKGIYETVTWQMRFPDGGLSNHSTSYSTYIDRLYASAQRGWWRLQPAFNATGAEGMTSDGPMELTAPAYQQTAQMDDFAMSIKENRATLAPGEEGLKDLKILEAIFKAAKSGKSTEVVY